MWLDGLKVFSHPRVGDIASRVVPEFSYRRNCPFAVEGRGKGGANIWLCHPDAAIFGALTARP